MQNFEGLETHDRFSIEGLSKRMASPYRINLPVYEGPLDLLLDLIRKQEMDIHNIPIAKSHRAVSRLSPPARKARHRRFRRFHLHGRDADPHQVENACCLPIRSPARKSRIRATNSSTACSNTKNSRTPRSFSTKSSRSKTTSGRIRTKLFTPATTVEGELVVSLVDLVKTFQQILERRKEVTKFELRHETVTIAQMMDRLRQRLAATDEPVSLIEFFEPAKRATP